MVVTGDAWTCRPVVDIGSVLLMSPKRLLACGAFALVLVACGGSSTNAMSEVRAACVTGVPAIDTATSTWGQTLDAYKASREHSKKADDADQQWKGLDYAFSTLIAAWTDAVNAGGREATDKTLDPARKSAALEAEGKWVKAADAAENLIRSECASAQRSS